MTDLRERVARAIADAALEPERWPLFLNEADAAIALIVGECAKVAEKNSEPWRSDAWVEGYAEGHEDVAHEIRALAKENKG